MRWNTPTTFALRALLTRTCTKVFPVGIDIGIARVCIRVGVACVGICVRRVVCIRRIVDVVRVRRVVDIVLVIVWTSTRKKSRPNKPNNPKWRSS